MCTLFVQLHEAAVAYNITHYDRGETTRRHPARRRITVPGSLDGFNIALAHGATPPEANLLLPSRTKSQSGLDQQKNLFERPSTRIIRTQYQRARRAAKTSSVDGGTDWRNPHLWRRFLKLQQLFLSRPWRFRLPQLRSGRKKDAIRRSRLSAAGVIEITSMCRLEYDHDHTTGRRFGA
jgi:hypothetical protein